MRVLVVLVAIALSGCVTPETDGDIEATEPSVSVSYSSSTQTNNQGTTKSVSATLKSVSGPIDDWSDLKITGCSAPTSGEIHTPHKFSKCSGTLTIKFTETGKVLYRSS